MLRFCANLPIMATRYALIARNISDTLRLYIRYITVTYPIHYSYFLRNFVA